MAEHAKFYREANQQVKKGMKKAMETWIEEQCQGIGENLQKKQQQESLAACKRTDKLETRENYYPGQSREMSHRRTRHSKEVDRVLFRIVYTHNRRSKGARYPSTSQQWQLPYPAGRSWSSSKITEERQVGRSGQHSIGAGQGKRRCYDGYATHHLQ